MKKKSSLPVWSLFTSFSGVDRCYLWLREAQWMALNHTDIKCPSEDFEITRVFLFFNPVFFLPLLMLPSRNINRGQDLAFAEIDKASLLPWRKFQAILFQSRGSGWVCFFVSLTFILLKKKKAVHQDKVMCLQGLGPEQYHTEPVHESTAAFYPHRLTVHACNFS